MQREKEVLDHGTRAARTSRVEGGDDVDGERRQKADDDARGRGPGRPAGRPAVPDHGAGAREGRRGRLGRTQLGSVGAAGARERKELRGELLGPVHHHAAAGEAREACVDNSAGVPAAAVGGRHEERGKAATSFADLPGEQERHGLAGGCSPAQAAARGET